MMYETPNPQDPLTQGDVIDACPLFGLEVPPAGVDLNAGPSRWRERVIVMTQACDLANAKTTKTLVAVVQPAQLLVDRGILKGSVIRDQVRRGQVYGWYFLPAGPDPIRLPESIVDLHDLHTVPRAVLERLVADGKRVGRVVTPYREHLAQHFAVTYMRIGLPAPYDTAP
jgi:hypothetical protein